MLKFSLNETKGYAILHKQICDNFPKCPSMLACEESAKKYNRSPAIYRDEDGRIDIHRDNCIGCAQCIDRCGLFRIAKNLYQEMEFQEEFDNDPRNEMDFFVERFGCDIINRQEYLLNDLNEVEEYINSTILDKVNILEFVNESHVMCPFQAIEVDSLKKQFLCIGEYKKFIIKSSDIDTFQLIKKHFSVVDFPAILLLHKKAILGSPIITEFRVMREEQRIEVQIALQKVFSERLAEVGLLS